MKTLYHIKRFNDVSEDLKVGDILEFKKGVLNPLRTEEMDFSRCYLDGTKVIDNKTYNNYKDIISFLDYDELRTKSESEIKYILNILEAYIHNSSWEKREMILEDVRVKHFVDKPSRYNCMWLTDEECIPHWLKLFKAKEGFYSINEIELDGNLFLSTEELLPNLIMKTEDIYNDAFHYWNPAEKDLINSPTKEYLFEGIAKVKRKIK